MPLVVGFVENIGKMKILIPPFYNHITIAKVICLALLFSPLWGLWWFNIDPDCGLVLVITLFSTSGYSTCSKASR